MPDAFTDNILSHGVPFDHTDLYASINQTDPPPPVSHFEPGGIQLSGQNAGIVINGLPVLTPPTGNRLIAIPEANGENNTEVLNAIRAVLIERGLASPE